MPVSAWSTTAASNGATLGIDIAENCAAANMNNAAREMMAQLKVKFDALDALVGGASFQPLDTDLTALAALVSAANKVPYATGSGTWELTTLSTFARTLIDDGDAATALATLGAIGGSVTTTGSGTSLNIAIGAVTYRLQFATGTGQSAEGAQSITWPVAFSTACLGATVGTQIGAGASNADSMYQLVGTPTTSTASVYLQVLDGNAVSHTPTIIGFGY